MAALVVSNYIFALNNEALNDGFSGLLDENETIEEAAASLSWIEVGDLLNDEVAQEMISGTLVNKEDILAETKLLMQEYLTIRETAFRQAKTENSRFVAAMNLLELGYLLEVNSAVPSDSNS